MSSNSTILVLNDHLEAVSKDEKLGNLLATVIGDGLSGKETWPIGNGVYVVESHPSTETAVIAVGNNTAKVLGLLPNMNPEADPKALVDAMAKRLGYRLIVLRRKGDKPKKSAPKSARKRA